MFTVYENESASILTWKSGEASSELSLTERTPLQNWTTGWVYLFLLDPTEFVLPHPLIQGRKQIQFHKHVFLAFGKLDVGQVQKQLNSICNRPLSEHYRIEGNPGLCIFQYVGDMLKHVMTSQWHYVVHELPGHCYCSYCISPRYELQYSTVPFNYTQVYFLKIKES